MINVPIAEKFVSIQGEGPYSGIKSLFIRLAGCNVGEYRPVQTLQQGYESFLLAREATCANVFGREFTCDTNYRKTENFDLEELPNIVKKNNLTNVIFTGGEPLIHKRAIQQLANLFPWLTLHLETSGTIQIPVDTFDFVVCSPKVGFSIDNAELIDCWKFVLTESRELKLVEEFLSPHVWKSHQTVYVTFDCFKGNFLINLEYGGTTTNIFDEAIKSSHWNPKWHLYKQQHKAMELR